MSYFGTTDPGLQRSKGKITGESPVFIAASNVDLDTGPAETIWKSTGAWVPPTQARTMSIVSSSNQDTIAGTGAQKITLEGIDGNGDAQSVEVDMNGTTPVVTTETWLGINPSDVTQAGSAGLNLGNITVTASVDLTVQSYFAIGDSLTSVMVYHVPNGFTLFIKQFKFAVYKSAGGAVDVIPFGIVVSDGISYKIYEIDLQEDVRPEDTTTLDQWYPVFEGTYIYFNATTTANNTTIRGGIECALVTNNLVNFSSTRITPAL